MRLLESIGHGLAAAACIVVLACTAAAQQQSDARETPDAVFKEAATAFDAGDYEGAVPLLDRVLGQLENPSLSDPAMQRQLVEAYEMRARSRFGLGDQDGARGDFEKLLQADPGHTLPTLVSPRIRNLFEEMRKTLVGYLSLTLNPDGVEVLLDGKPIPKETGARAVMAGEHRVEVRKNGHRTELRTMSVAGGEILSEVITLERIAATISVSTIPPGIEVLLDGVSAGTTTPRPSSPEQTNQNAAPDAQALDESSQLILQDVARGEHLVTFRKDCFVSSDQLVQAPEFSDYRLAPVRLTRAVGTIAIESSIAGEVFVDAVNRGKTPLTVNDVCQGSHSVEVRSNYGKYLTRVDVRTGARAAVRAEVRPTMAILSATGLEDLRGAPDLRTQVANMLQKARSVMVFAPPASEVGKALEQERLGLGWMSFDSAHQPIGSAAANLTSDARRDLSTRLAKVFDAQALVSITAPLRDKPFDVWLTILSAGVGEPDTIRLQLDDEDSVRRALEQIDAQPVLFRPSVGLRLADVHDVTGTVIVSVEPGGPAATAGLSPGDTIVSVNGEPVGAAAQFNMSLAAGSAEQPLALVVHGPAGSAKLVTLRSTRVPQAIAKDNQTILFNKLLLDLRSGLERTPAAADEAVTRLNLGIALMGVGAWTEARAELQKVRLPNGPGVANGTVQYLIGLCQEALGQAAEAKIAWQAAASTPAMLTGDGPAIKELAQAKLAR